MDTEKLQEYLSVLVELEKEKQTQASAIKQLEKKINDNESAVNSTDLMLALDMVANECDKDIPDNISVSQEGKWLAYFGVYYCGFMGAWLFGVVANLIFRLPVLTFIAGVAGAVLGGSIPWRYWKNVLENRRIHMIEKYRKMQKADEQAIVERRRKNDELATALPKLREALSCMKNIYSDTAETLEKYYAVNVIPNDYRSMVPVCMFYDYIKNKRTYSIERNPVTSDIGAINMYEDEMYKRLIVTKLNDVISNLNRIQQNQAVLYDAVMESNRETQRLIKSVDDNISDFRNNVDRKMDVMIYQNERIQKHAEYLHYVAYQDYMSR